MFVVRILGTNMSINDIANNLTQETPIFFVAKSNITFPPIFPTLSYTTTVENHRPPTILRRSSCQSDVVGKYTLYSESGSAQVTQHKLSGFGPFFAGSSSSHTMDTSSSFAPRA